MSVGTFKLIVKLILFSFLSSMTAVLFFMLFERGAEGGNYLDIPLNTLPYRGIVLISMQYQPS